MKIQRKILVVICIAAISALLSHPVKAQQTNITPEQKQQVTEAIKNITPEQMAKLQTGMMKTKLGLDSATVLKVYDINLKAAQKLDPLLKDESGRKFAKLRELKAIGDQKDKDLKGVLSADQYKQYETMKEEMKEKMKEKMQAKKDAISKAN